MKTQVFAYKGVIGIKADVENGVFISNPYHDPGSMGFVCDASEVEVSAEALELLKQISKGEDSLGDIDCFKSEDGKVIFGWMGPNTAAIKPEDAEVARDTDFSLLTATEGVETDPSFINFIDLKEAAQ